MSFEKSYEIIKQIFIFGDKILILPWWVTYYTYEFRNIYMYHY